MIQQVIHGEALEELRKLPDNSVDAICADPPAGVAFMGKEWDTDKGGRDAWVAWLAEIMSEALRVVKPGGHALVWSLPRTSHWTAYALENAGFEIRDSIEHVFSQGFPKSLNVTKLATKAGLCCSCQRNDVQYPIKGVYHENRTTEGIADYQDLRNLQEAMATEDKISSGPQFNMQQGMRGETHFYSKQGTFFTYGDMSAMRNGVSPEESYGNQESSTLLNEMRGATQDTRPGVCQEIEGNSGYRPGGLVGRNEETIQIKADGSEQPGMERRSNVQADTRQLQGSEIHPLSGGIYSNGAAGRIRYGTSSSYGPPYREMLNPDGSSTSHRPQSSEQRNKQPSTIPQQRGAQTCGTCGKPIIEDGLGSALKPAHETWWLCRKPLAEKSIAAQVLATGTGAINIDACRIASNANEPNARKQKNHLDKPMDNAVYGAMKGNGEGWTGANGRWPANILLSHSIFCTQDGTKRVKGTHGHIPLTNKTKSAFNGGNCHTSDHSNNGYADSEGYETVEAWICAEDCPVRLLDEQSGVRKSQRSKRGGVIDSGVSYSLNRPKIESYECGYNDEGGASRFFYCPKPSRSERNAGCEAFPEREGRMCYDSKYHEGGGKLPAQTGNNHPTVKSINLMRYLVRLITPPDGIVLDMFAGSGTTALACIQEGFGYILIEREQEYIDIINARINHAYAGQRRH